MIDIKPAIWFPTVRTNTGTDVFTERLVQGLNKQGIKAEITWLPLRAEYLPWTVPIPSPPKWATIVHVNTWLHTRFLPKQLPVIATLHHAIHDPELHPRKGMLRAAYHRYWIAPNERRVMQLANHVTAVSQFVAKMAPPWAVIALLFCKATLLPSLRESAWLPLLALTRSTLMPERKAICSFPPMATILRPYLVFLKRK